MDDIEVLFVTDNYEKYKYTQAPQGIKSYSWEQRKKTSRESFDIVIIDRNVTEKERDELIDIANAYCMFYVDGNYDAITKNLFDRKMAQSMIKDAVEPFLREEGRNFFHHSYGEKQKPNDIGIAQGFKGQVKWNGQYSVSINGDYGQDFNQIAFWRYNVPIEPGQALNFWLEYKKDPSVEIRLEMRKIVSGSLSDISQMWTFDEADLEDEIIVENDYAAGSIFVSLLARGSGKLDIVALHDRHSRRGWGTFMVGGERYVTKDREEIFCYFDPGDLKPPLAVYFSGYKTMEGFEGYHMMKKMGCPFLLISEQRFEGGGFYQGSEEFEKLMIEIIEKHLGKLGFYQHQLILSGISMGTIGAMYYGCVMRPHALILGKPLASLGDIAANERLKRPKGFPTSLDLLSHFAGGMDEDAIERLNDRFWSKIRNTDFSHTKFIVSYMFEDDYDATAYERLLSELNSAGVQVYGKGLHGRHNDNTAGIGTWFKSQYVKVLKDDFNR